MKEGGREKVPSAEVDVLDWVMRTALDLIGLGGLGYDFGALKGTHDPYSETARHLLYASFYCILCCCLTHLLTRMNLDIDQLSQKSASSHPSSTSS